MSFDANPTVLSGSDVTPVCMHLNWNRKLLNYVN